MLLQGVQVHGEPDAASSREDVSFSADLELLRSHGVAISEVWLRYIATSVINTVL